jgi:subtilisin family serine protease
LEPLDLVRLTPLMELTSGSASVSVGLIDGPVSTDLPDLIQANIRAIPGVSGGSCVGAGSAACTHGTLVAAILVAKRGSRAPSICPGCTLLLRPIFAESTQKDGRMPSATPEELAKAIVETVKAGARIINLSVGLLRSNLEGERALGQALDYAAGHGAIILVAAGNQGTVGSSTLTRHPWVIPVAGCDLRGRPTGLSNLGSSIGRRGLSAPGTNITSLGPDGKPRPCEGTSVATPFVTGAAALIWSEFPMASAGQLKLAMTGGDSRQRAAIVPPLLDAWAAYQRMLSMSNKR